MDLATILPTHLLFVTARSYLHTYAHPNQPTNISYVADLNANITQLPSLGPYSKYEVPEEKVKGKLELTWIGEVRVIMCCVNACMRSGETCP